MIHSIWRWVVVLVALAALVKWGLGWLQRKKPDLLDRRLLLILTSVLDVQLMLGIIVLALQASAGGIQRQALEHAVVMVIAVVIAHLSAMWRKRDDTAVLRNNFLVVLVVAVLIFVGVMRVGGWG
jgi:hypothetical protein